MNIIDEFRRVTEDIYIIKSKLYSINREINKLINAYKPSEVKGIDYSKDRVQNNNMQIDVFDNYAKMQDLLRDRDNVEKEIDDLYKQRGELEKCINDLGDINKKVLMLKIKGFTNWKIADILHYSVRRIEQIVAESKKKIKDI